MRFFYTKDFEGVWPVGTCAVAVANNEYEARRLLEASITAAGLSGTRSDGTPFTVIELAPTQPIATVLLNGDY